VVVSQPHRTFGGVVQYDVGKTTPSEFERSGSLNCLPQALLSAVTRAQANELRGRSKLSEHASKLERIAKFQHVKAGPGILFEARTTTKAGRRATGAAPTDKRLSGRARAMGKWRCTTARLHRATR
jgi:hypothetical protein